MGEQLTFGELWRTARWRWRALLAAFLACGVAGYALFALLPGRYTARALVYVSSSREVDAGELSAAQKLADTCALLLSGDEAVSGAAARCGLAGTPDELRRGVSVTALGGTGVVRIEASAPSAEVAAAFANALAEGAPGVLAEVVGGGSAVTAAPARLPSRPDGPPAAACAGIAALCGAAMTLLVLCARGEPGGPPLVHGLAGEGAARLREYAGGERRLAVLGPGELRVACALAGEDARVLLLAGSERDGLSELLSGRCDPPDLLARGPVPGVDLLPVGEGPAALTPEALSALLLWAETRYGRVLFPVAKAGEAAMLSAGLVVTAQSAREARRALRGAKKAGARAVCGVVWADGQKKQK